MLSGRLTEVIGSTLTGFLDEFATRHHIPADVRQQLHAKYQAKLKQIMAELVAANTAQGHAQSVEQLETRFEELLTSDADLRGTQIGDIMTKLRDSVND